MTGVALWRRAGAHASKESNEKMEVSSYNGLCPTSTARPVCCTCRAMIETNSHVHHKVVTTGEPPAGMDHRPYDSAQEMNVHSQNRAKTPDPQQPTQLTQSTQHKSMPGPLQSDPPQSSGTGLAVVHPVTMDHKVPNPGEMMPPRLPAIIQREPSFSQPTSLLLHHAE